jgi:hypothetical protein
MKWLKLILLGMIPLSCFQTVPEEVFNQTPHPCPKQTRLFTESWGATGVLRSCVRFQGQWTAWQPWGKAIDGFYLDDQKHGTWTYFRSDHSVEKVEEYDHGKLVFVQNHGQKTNPSVSNEGTK